MTWIKTILHEIFGLFVDDLSFAAAILVWLVVVGLITTFALPHLGLAPAWTAIVLFLGLAVILVESTLRFSRNQDRQNRDR